LITLVAALSGCGKKGGGVVETSIHITPATVSLEQGKFAALSVADPSGLQGQRTLTAWERYLPELFNPVDLPPGDPLRRVLIVEGHQRLLYPLYTLTFAMLGLALIAPAASDRSRQRLAMAAASLAVIGLQGVNLTLRNLANAEPGLAPLMYIGPLVPLVVATLLLFKQRRPIPRSPARPPLLPGLAAR